MAGCADQIEKVISHILEIIYLMTGEEYMIIKKPSQEKCFLQAPEDLCQITNSVLEIAADSPIHVRRSSGCVPASWAPHGMPENEQKEHLHTAFQPPPGGAQVQIKCDDVAMCLSLEEWEYLEHHKEEYNAMIGKNEPTDGPNGQSLHTGYLSQLDSDQGAVTTNYALEDTMDLNSEHKYPAAKVSCIEPRETNFSPKRESSDKTYREKNVTAETQSRDVSTLQNNPTLTNEPLSALFLDAEIKGEQADSEYAMDSCKKVRISTSGQEDSPSVDRHVSTLQNKPTLNMEPLSALLLDTEIKGEQTDSEYAMDSCKKVRIGTSGQEDSPSVDRDISTLQNNPTLNKEPLSALLLATEIKGEQTDSEYAMDSCKKVRINTSDQEDSQSVDKSQNLVSGMLQKTYSHDVRMSLIDSCQIKKIKDSSVQSNYNLDFVLQSSFEKLQHTSIHDHQSKMAASTNSTFMDTRTSFQSHFGDKLQGRHTKKWLVYKKSLLADQDPNTVEDSGFAQNNDYTLSTTNSYKDAPHTTHIKNKLPKQEYSTDGHQTKPVNKEDRPLEKNHTEIIPNIFEKNYIGGKVINEASLLDETKKEASNDSSMDDGAFGQLSNRFGLQSIKTELIEERATNGYQKETMDTILKYGKTNLTYQECLLDSQQTMTEEVHHSSSLGIAGQSSNMPSTHLDDHFSIKEPTHLSKASTWISTGKVQLRSKPLKTIPCMDCGKRFSYNSDLSRHRRLHTGEKPFTCSECGKSFSWMSSLVTHKRTHLGEKPFSCKQCGKRFSDYSGIIKHQRSHTGENPYSCLVCGEHFAETYQLVKHQAVHFANMWQDSL